MLFDVGNLHLYHLGFVAAAALGIAVIVLLLPKGRRRRFLAPLAYGWVSGFGAGAIVVALFYVPFVGYSLMHGLDKLLPLARKVGIDQSPFGTILVVFSVLGIVIGLVRGVIAAWGPRQSATPN